MPRRRAASPPAAPATPLLRETIFVADAAYIVEGTGFLETETVVFERIVWRITSALKRAPTADLEAVASEQFNLETADWDDVEQDRLVVTITPAQP